MKTKTKSSCSKGEGAKSITNAKTVRYGRLKNLGNFENERCEIEVAVQPGETAREAFARAKAEVDELLGFGSTPESAIDLAEKALKKARTALRDRGSAYDPCDYDDER